LSQARGTNRANANDKESRANGASSGAGGVSGGGVSDGSGRADGAGRADEREKVTIKGFYLATLLFAANVALFLKIDLATFLKHSKHAYEHISRENYRRKAHTVDPDPG
jgi:hypothetical protein